MFKHKVVTPFIFRHTKLKRQLTVQIAVAQSRSEAFCVSVTIFWDVLPFNTHVPTFRSDMLPTSSGWKLPGRFEFAGSSATLVPVYQITRCHIPQ
jgi:hypothetical protein